MSINRGMDEEDAVHVYNEILLSHKKEWNNAICSIMDLEIIIVSDYVRKRKINIIQHYLYVEF